MSLALLVQSYADFQTAVNAVPRKFTIFYTYNAYSPETTPSNFKCWALSTDMQAIITMTEISSVPSTFATDYPSAVQFTSGLGPSPLPFAVFASVFTSGAV
jgi:hypothetical protein